MIKPLGERVVIEVAEGDVKTASGPEIYAAIASYYFDPDSCMRRSNPEQIKVYWEENAAGRGRRKRSA